MVGLLPVSIWINGKTAESSNIFKTWLIYELQTEMGVWGLAPNHNVHLLIVLYVTNI